MDFRTFVPGTFLFKTNMKNLTFSGHFRDRKSCVNFVLSFWNPIYQKNPILPPFGITTFKNRKYTNKQHSKHTHFEGEMRRIFWLFLLTKNKVRCWNKISNDFKDHFWTLKLFETSWMGVWAQSSMRKMAWSKVHNFTH